MTSTGDRYYRFLSGLRFEESLPKGISVINPYPQPEVRRVLKLFCEKFYADDRPRMLILGINPGRFGAGITGIPFTDPVALDRFCGIQNDFQKRLELSSSFVYEVIQAYGGVQSFYRQFLVGSVCPLGFLSGIKNCNFYDFASQLFSVREFVSVSLQKQAAIAGRKDVAVVFGKRNAAVLAEFNSHLKLFDTIRVLEHPRFIMQYRRKSLLRHVQEFCARLDESVSLKQ